MKTSMIILGLLGRALFSAKFTFDPKKIVWEEVFKESRAQAVDLLVFDTLTDEERSAIPEEIATAWQAAAFQRLRFNEQLRYEQTHVLKKLEQAEISCVVLKGFSCAINYPNPSLRCAGDIDLLVGMESMERARRVLEACGYVALEEPHPFHLSMRKDWKIVELHHEPGGIPQGEVGEKLRLFFQNSERKTKWRNGIPSFPEKEQAVTLILHKLRHIVTSGLGLRQVCDWAVFVHAQLSAEVWQYVKPALKEFGLLHFTEIITRICVDWLYLPEDSAPWCMDADKQVVDALLADILRTGNFGRKENRYGQRLFTDANSGNRITSFVKVGVQTCRNHWPVCETYPVLLPIAPLILLGRYRKQRKEGLRPAFRPYEVYKGAKDRQTLYVSLKPFVEES